MRVNDILSELERQLAPLERQSEKAHLYLKKKEELKEYDVNMFLLEVERIEQLLDEAGKNFEIASEHLTETKEQHEKMKSEYAAMEEAMTQMDEKISNLKDSIAGTDVTKGKLEGQINVLKEQIHTAQLTKEHLGERIASIEVQQEERRQQGSTYDAQRQEYETQLAAIEKTREQAQEKLQSIQAEITRCRKIWISGSGQALKRGKMRSLSC